MKVCMFAMLIGALTVNAGVAQTTCTNAYTSDVRTDWGGECLSVFQMLSGNGYADVYCNGGNYGSSNPQVGAGTISVAATGMCGGGLLTGQIINTCPPDFFTTTGSGPPWATITGLNQYNVGGVCTNFLAGSKTSPKQSCPANCPGCAASLPRTKPPAGGAPRFLACAVRPSLSSGRMPARPAARAAPPVAPRDE
jgi:hypothetical protein